MDSKEKLKLASLIAGILSLIFLLFGLALPIGALGVLFALLSRDTEKLEGRAMTGFVLSLIGLIIGAISTISSFYLLSSGTYEKMLEELNEETQGEDDYIQQLRDYLQQLQEQNGRTGCADGLPDTPAILHSYDNILYEEIRLEEVRL